MSVPHQLKLVNHRGKAKLVAEPVAELWAKNRTIHTCKSVEVKDKYNAWRHNCENGAYVAECNIENTSAQVVGLKLFNDSGDWVDVCFDFAEGVLKVDRTNSGALDFHKKFASVSIAPLSEATKQNLKVVVDRSSIECFTDIAALSNLVFPNGCYTRLSFYTIGGSATISDLTIKDI